VKTIDICTNILEPIGCQWIGGDSFVVRNILLLTVSLVIMKTGQEFYFINCLRVFKFSTNINKRFLVYTSRRALPPFSFLVPLARSSKRDVEYSEGSHHFTDEKI
jgi:hypothetical protein